MEKEIKITPPDGYEIDRENSTFECIKFKPVIKRWRDEEYTDINGYFINNASAIIPISQKYNNDVNRNIFASKKQAKSALAMAYISQIMVNDKRFGGVITDEEWNNMTIKYCIMRHFSHRIAVGNSQVEYYFLAFHTSKQRDLFLKENEDLVKDYFMLD